MPSPEPSTSTIATSGSAHPDLAAAAELVTTLVGFRTVTQSSNLDLIDHVEGLLTGLDATCSRTWDPFRGKANLFATIGPPVDGGVVLSGHTDVVPAQDVDNWTTSPWEATLRDGRLYGRGTTDMKGFIACALALAPAFAAAELARPLHLAFTFDEEIGCQGAPLLLGQLAQSGPRPAAAIIGEPTLMDVITAHKGCHEYTTTITGLAGHGSSPDTSVNAIWHAARYVMRLHQIADELRSRARPTSPFDPPESTLSIGTIRGGQARNVIPASCSFDWEFRPVNRADALWVADEVATLEADMAAELAADHPDAGIATATAGEVGGLDADEGSAAVALALRLLDDPRLDVASYSTEAGLFHEAGIPAVVCGPGSIDQAHRVDEYVELSQLSACLDMLQRLLQDLQAVT